MGVKDGVSPKSLDPEKKVKKRRKDKKKQETYKTYIYKVLKQVHPDIGISNKAMSVVNSFVQDAFEKMAFEAGRLVRYNKKETLGAREVESAFKLILPQDLAQHAVREGHKAITKFMGNMK